MCHLLKKFMYYCIEAMIIYIYSSKNVALFIVLFRFQKFLDTPH